MMRDSWIDSARGMAIILVVFGHIMINNTTTLWPWIDFIYSFHMQAFFIISGLVFSKKYLEMNLISFIGKKAKSILVPYGLFSLVLYAYIYFFDVQNLGNIEFRGFFGNIAYLVEAIVFGKDWTGSLWFLPTIFSAELILYALFKNKRNYTWPFLWVIAIIGYLNGRNYFVTVPFKLDYGAFSVLFVAIGYVFQLNKERLKLWLGKTSTFFLLLIIMVWITGYKSSVLHFYTDPYYSLGFSSAVMAVITGIVGTLLLLSFSCVLQHSKIIRKIGQNSLQIYCIHYMVYPNVCMLFSKYLPRASAGNEIDFSVVTTVCVITICMLFSETVSTLKRKFSHSRLKANYLCKR